MMNKKSQQGVQEKKQKKNEYGFHTHPFLLRKLIFGIPLNL